MESIGQTIKTRRGERGLTLGEAHEATKITMQNLAAIEEDRFDAFPNRVYARAFLRDYANYLALDSADLLQRYEQEWGTPVAAPARGGGSRSFPIVIGAVLLLAVVAVAGFFYVKYMPRPEKPAKPTETIAVNPPPKPAHVPRKPILKPIKANPNPPVTTGAPIAPVTGTHPGLGTTTNSAGAIPLKPMPANPNKVVVQVKAARGPSWITVRVDGRLTDSRLMKAGGSAGYQGKSNVWVRFGNAGNVDVTANGKHIGAMGGPGKVVNKLFTKPAAVPGVPARPRQ